MPSKTRLYELERLLGDAMGYGFIGRATADRQERRIKYGPGTIVKLPKEWQSIADALGLWVQRVSGDRKGITTAVSWNGQRTRFKLCGDHRMPHRLYGLGSSHLRGMFEAIAEIAVDKEWLQMAIAKEKEHDKGEKILYRRVK